MKLVWGVVLLAMASLAFSGNAAATNWGEYQCSVDDCPLVDMSDHGMDPTTLIFLHNVVNEDVPIWQTGDQVTFCNPDKCRTFEWTPSGRRWYVKRTGFWEGLLHWLLTDGSTTTVRPGTPGGPGGGAYVGLFGGRSFTIWIVTCSVSDGGSCYRG